MLLPSSASTSTLVEVSLIITLNHINVTSASIYLAAVPTYLAAAPIYVAAASNRKSILTLDSDLYDDLDIS